MSFPLRTAVLALAFALIAMPQADAQSLRGPGGSVPPGFKLYEEHRRDAKNQDIIIRRYVDGNGDIVRIRYFVKTGSFGYTPGKYNPYHDIVEPRFDTNNNDRFYR